MCVARSCVHPIFFRTRVKKYLARARLTTTYKFFSAYPEVLRHCITKNAVHEGSQRYRKSCLVECQTSNDGKINHLSKNTSASQNFAVCFATSLQTRSCLLTLRVRGSIFSKTHRPAVTNNFHKHFRCNVKPRWRRQMESW